MWINSLHFIQKVMKEWSTQLVCHSGLSLILQIFLELSTYQQKELGSSLFDELISQYKVLKNEILRNVLEILLDSFKEETSKYFKKRYSGFSSVFY